MISGAHSRRSAQRLDLSARRPPSYLRLAIVDAVGILGITSFACGVLGLFDDGGDALLLLLFGGLCIILASSGRRSLSRILRPAPGRVLSGLALSWTVLVLLGTGIYLASGATDHVADAFVESAAGFSTTNLSSLDPSELTVPIQLWRASTQWIGGLVGILVGAIALPLAFRGRELASSGSRQTADRLAPNPVLGRRRVVLLYGSITAALGVGYRLTGLGTRDSVVHAMTTISTGGFSSQPDSFVGFGTGSRVVATIGMVIGGSSIFVIWWIFKGRAKPILHSTELRLYLGLLAVGTLLVTLGTDGIGTGDAIFTAASALSTTGFAVGDWTVFDDSVLMVLLVLIGTGSMSGSAGGGLRVMRAWTLVGYASRELRRQLDPHSVVVVKQSGVPIDERTLEHTTGYQITHLGLCGLAAFVLAAGGVDVTGAIFSGVSVISTHGPGVGAGPFGDISEWSPAARLLTTPFMLAGRMTILPLLLAISGVFATQKAAIRQSRRILRKITSR